MPEIAFPAVDQTLLSAFDRPDDVSTGRQHRHLPGLAVDRIALLRAVIASQHLSEIRTGLVGELAKCQEKVIALLLDRRLGPEDFLGDTLEVTDACVGVVEFHSEVPLHNVDPGCRDLGRLGRHARVVPELQFSSSACYGLSSVAWAKPTTLGGIYIVGGLVHDASRLASTIAWPSLRSGPYNRGVPELPDLSILADAFEVAMARRPVLSVEAPGPLTVRGTPAELEALVGQRLERFYRRGKFLWLEFERDRVVINAMLTGRLQLAGTPAAKKPPKTLFILGFGSRARPPEHTASWTSGATWIPAADATPELRYRDPTQMGKVYLLPRGVDRPVPGTGVDELGPDADDAALTLDAWRSRICRYSGELKNVLRNQAFVAGIGNAYSDEILHAAQLLPTRRRSALAPEEIDELYEATRATLSAAIATLRDRVPPTFETEVRDFLAVHNKGGQACPRCGQRISQTEAGGFITSYCRHCQH